LTHNVYGGDLKLEHRLIGQISYGFETNVFQSQENPRDDFYILVEGSTHFLIRPSSRDTIYVDILGSYQAFQRLKNSNQFFIDTAIDLQHKINSFWDVGFSQIFSYNDLKLLDTEGEPLPGSKIGSVNYQSRFYVLLFPGDDWVGELGGGFRRKDVEESEGLISLDLNAFFGDAALRYYFTRSSLIRLKYVGSYFDYDRLKAGTAPTGIPSEVSPGLAFKRHDIKFKVYIREFEKIQAIGIGKFRYNEDPYQQDLSYDQYEGVGQVKVKIFWNISVNSSMAYRIRDYRTRASNVFVDPNSGQILPARAKLKENFLIFEASVYKKLFSPIDLSLRYVWIKKNTNAIGGDFESAQGTIGLRATF
jgi:hypothetical protein